MAEVPGWTNIAVVQRREKTGCIPAAFEWLVRMAGAPGVDLPAFQDDFDLAASSRGGNSFESVRAAVLNKYPHVRVIVERFPMGAGTAKLRTIETLLAEGVPCVAALILEKGRDFHAMPVVRVDHDALTFIHSANATGRLKMLVMKRSTFIRKHDETDGGRDIAYLRQPAGGWAVGGAR